MEGPAEPGARAGEGGTACSAEGPEEDDDIGCTAGEAVYCTVVRDAVEMTISMLKVKFGSDPNSNSSWGLVLDSAIVVRCADVAKATVSIHEDSKAGAKRGGRTLNYKTADHSASER